MIDFITLGATSNGPIISLAYSIGEEVTYYGFSVCSPVDVADFNSGFRKANGRLTATMMGKEQNWGEYREGEHKSNEVHLIQLSGFKKYGVMGNDVFAQRLKELIFSIIN